MSSASAQLVLSLQALSHFTLYSTIKYCFIGEEPKAQ